MAQTADTVAVEIEARLNTASVRAAGAEFDQSMNRIAGSAGKAETAVGQSFGKIAHSAGSSRAAVLEMQHVVRASVDQFAAGAPVSQIFAQHLAQVGQAAALSGGTFGKMGAILSGPWGLAVVAGTAILATLIPKLFETGESVESLIRKLQEHHDKTLLSDEADRIWSHTLDGVIDRNKKLNEELQKRITNQSELNKLELAEAQRDAAQKAARVAQARADPNTTPADMAKFEQLLTAANVRLHNLTLLAGREQGEALADLAVRTRLWAEEQQTAIKTIVGTHPELTQFTDQLTAASERVRQAMEAAAAQDLNLDPTIKRVNLLNDTLLHGRTTVEHYAAMMGRLAAQLKAAAEAAREAKRGIDADLTTFQRPVTGGTITGRFGDTRPGRTHAGVDIAVPVGTPVRAPAGGVVIESGEVQGYGQAIYIDHGRGTITRLGHLSRRDVAKGAIIEAGQIIGASGNTGRSTGPHLHYEVRVGGRAVDPFKPHPTDFAGTQGRAEQLAAQAEREAQKEAAQRAAFNAEMERLQQDLVVTTRGRVTSAAQQLEFDQQSVLVERDRSIAAYQAAADQNRITQAQADLLIAKVNELATAKTMRLYAEEGLRKAAMYAQLDAERQQGVIDQLQFEADNARTAAERRTVALALLDAELELQRIRLQQVIDATASGTAEHELAVLRLSQLTAERGRRQFAISRDPRNMTPSQAYATELQQTAGQINESIDAIAVDGLRRLNDELTSAIMGTESLGEAFSRVADQIIAALIKIAIQQLVIKPLMQLFGSGGGGGGSGFASLLSMFGGSGGGGFDASGFASIVASNAAAGFASGGSVRGGMPIRVGEQGPELFVPSGNGMIVPNHALARLGGGGNALVEVQIVAGEYFDARVGRVTGPVIARASVQAAQGGSRLARQDLGRRQQNRLE